MNIKRVSDYIWEIEKEGTMSVPCRVFASKELLDNMSKDRTLKQGVNVTSLPGIQKYAVIMPDGHEGYGFPIGGVAALDFNEGGISPGGIGYDINCLAKGSKILDEFGYLKNIEDFENDFVTVNQANKNLILKSKVRLNSLVSLNTNSKKMCSRNVLFFMKRRYNGPIINIRTKLGYSILVTPEHPVLTKEGMVPSKHLKMTDTVAINPYVGVDYLGTPLDIQISRNIFTKDEISKIKEFGLLSDQRKLGIITKLFGYLLGDGYIYFISGKKGRLAAYGKDSDLELIKHDIEELGFNARIVSRIRLHKITSQYGTKTFASRNSEVYICSTLLAKLFVSLGYPIGKKASTDFLVPSWITNSPLWIKRLFLSGLFGAELTTPKCTSRTNFGCPVLSMNKNKNFKENGRAFLIQIMGLLGEFNVSVDKIHERAEYPNKLGNVYRLRLQISSNNENLINLWTKIGFSYNAKRDLISKISVLYIQEKENLKKLRNNTISKIKELKKKGLNLKEVQFLLSSEYLNARFIERHYYENKTGRIPISFISFGDFLKKHLNDYIMFGTFFDEIYEIKQERYDDFVYDLNVDETHNFIANSIIVSNCGVRLLKTNLTKEQVYPVISDLLETLFKFVPAGIGESNIRISNDQLDVVLNNGAKWAVENNYGVKEDLLHCEENGSMKTADSAFVSPTAKKRGKNQLGTLGSGNHFLEVQFVDEVFDPHTAKVFGLEKDQVTVMIHCGSRGLGHQVCSDYLREMEKTFPDIVKNLPDRELIYAPSGHPLCEKYLKAMSAAANFAWCNRHIIAHQVRLAFKTIFPDAELRTVYDVAHNIAKIEEHDINGQMKTVFLHRKGATRAFPKEHKDLPEVYRHIGQPVIIPGSMGTASYVLVGTSDAMKLSFGSTAHGAGRTMSRHDALREYRGEKIKRELENEKIFVKAASWSGIAEEAPKAYKDIEKVVDVSHNSGIAKKVVRVKPIGVIKG